jgi:hypothetical protein
MLGNVDIGNNMMSGYATQEFAAVNAYMVGPKGIHSEKLASMYRIILVCDVVPAHAGAVAAQDITEEFTHRPWHRDASCVWDGSNKRS